MTIRAIVQALVRTAGLTEWRRNRARAISLDALRRFAFLVACLILSSAGWAAGRWWPSPFISELVTLWPHHDLSPSQVFCFDPASQGFDIACMTTIEISSFGTYKGGVYVTDDVGQIYDQINVPGKIQFVAGRDVDGDGIEEVIVAFHDSTMAAVRIYKWPALSEIVAEYRLNSMDCSEFLPRHLPWESRIEIGPVLDGILPGRPALTLVLVSGFGCMPRGIIAIDPLSGSELWRFWHAANIRPQFALVPLNGDRGPLMIAGSHASFNGATWRHTTDNGATWRQTTDERCYLIALTGNGELAWEKEFSGPFSSVMPYVVPDSAGTGVELFAYYTGHHAEGPPDRLMRIDPRTGQINRAVVTGESGLVAQQIFPWRDGPDGERQMLIATGRAEVSVYDTQLQLRGRSRAGNPIMIVDDVDQNGRLEIVSSTLQGWAIYDDGFRLIHEVKDMQVSPYAVQRTRSSPLLRIWGGAPDGHRCYELRANPARRFAWFTLAGVVLGTGLTGFVGRRWLVRTRQRKLQSRVEQERRDAWAAMASKLAHDIRTPLSVLRLSAQNLELELRSRFGRIPEDLQHYFECFTTEVDRVSAVSQAFLKFARLSPPRLESVDLATIVRDVVERHPHPDRISVDFQHEPELPAVMADRQQLSTLIENLFSNSFKAMKGSGKLTINLFRAQELHKPSDQRDWLVMEIQDTGKGIAREDLPHVFDPYFSRSDGGTGLGLAIVKKIVEDHRGNVKIESAVGLGTTVRVRIPVPVRSAAYPQS